MKRSYEPLSGRVTVPGDKSISHRSALFGLLSRDPVELRDGWTADTRASLEAVRALAQVRVYGLRSPPYGLPPNFDTLWAWVTLYQRIDGT
ncbi:MAG: hypothetical protein KOO60_10565 [Gemmatimonadales bacterium]|nr:hypothetical protein [Gemmatimonadales bacterium]